MQSLVKTPTGKHYMVSTRDTLDVGWETMIFHSDGRDCDELSVTVVDWVDVFRKLYKNEKEATIGHMEIVNFMNGVKEWQKN